MLQETKCESFSERLANFIWGGRDKNWVELPSERSSGGVVVLWDPTRVMVID